MSVLSDLKTFRKEFIICIYPKKVFLYVGGLNSTVDYRLKISLARFYYDSLILKGFKQESHRGKMKNPLGTSPNSGCLFTNSTDRDKYLSWIMIRLYHRLRESEK